VFYIKNKNLDKVNNTRILVTADGFVDRSSTVDEEVERALRVARAIPKPMAPLKTPIVGDKGGQIGNCSLEENLLERINPLFISRMTIEIWDSLAENQRDVPRKWVEDFGSFRLWCMYYAIPTVNFVCLFLLFFHFCSKVISMHFFVFFLKCPLHFFVLLFLQTKIINLNKNWRRVVRIPGLSDIFQ